MEVLTHRINCITTITWENAEVRQCQGQAMPRSSIAEVRQCRGQEMWRLGSAEVRQCKGQEMRWSGSAKVRHAEVSKCRGWAVVSTINIKASLESVACS
jgi:hypothetical protein